MKETYTEDIRFLEMEEVFLGHQEVSDRIGKVLELAPPTLIQLEGVIENHDYVQWEWSVVHPSGGTARGWEVFHLKGDLIDTLIVFTPDMHAGRRAGAGTARWCGAARNRRAARRVPEARRRGGRRVWAVRGAGRRPRGR
ncbi:hypothetical protein GCM10027360_92520 [Amycolatopsis echigonensis]